MEILNKISVTDRINAKSIAGDVVSPVNGDIWYNSSLTKFRKKENGVVSDLDTGAGTLQQVTTLGNTTTNSIFVQGIEITNNGALATIIGATDQGLPGATEIIAIGNNAGKEQIINGTIIIANGTANPATGIAQVLFKPSSSIPSHIQDFSGLTNQRTVLWQDNDGTLAFLSDVATKENSLGNPGTNGYVLSSTIAGVRSWIANGGGVTSVGAPGAGSTNGATITGSVLNLDYATGTQPGIVSTAAQTFGGNKTFLGDISVYNGAVKIGNSANASYYGIWFNQPTPSLSNFSFLLDTYAGENATILNGEGGIKLRANNNSGSQTKLDTSGNLQVGVGEGVSALGKLHVNGDLYLSSAFKPNNLPGTAGQVLTSGGAGAVPTWATLAGGGNVSTTTANLYDAGMKQTFRGGATNAGVNFGGGLTGNPSTLVTGDFWYRTDENKFRYYDGTTTRALVSEALTQTLTNKTLTSPVISTIINTGTLTLPTTTGTLALTSQITGTNSGTNTGDNAANTLYANDYRAANFVAGTNYQAPLVSGTNIRTVNGNTLLGSTDLVITGPADLTGITNTTANSGYPTGTYGFNALVTDGFGVDGRLTGAKSGTTNVQRLQGWATGNTYARYWINGTTSWSTWSLYIDASSNNDITLLAVITEPATPATDTLLFYPKKIAGKMFLKTKGPSGLDSPLQNAFWQNNITIWNPSSVTAGVWQGTVSAVTSAGTYSVGAPTTTNLYTIQARGRYANVITTANQVLGVRQTNSASFFLGNTAGQGGFFFYCRMGTDVWTNGGRMFIGLTANNAGTVVSADPSLTNNSVGFCIDAADNGLISFMMRSTSVTKTSTTYTTSSNKGYDLYMFAAPNSTTVGYRIVDTIAGTEVTGSVSATPPAVNTNMYINAVASNAALTPVTSVQLGLNRIYVETDY